jgi:hypothetical protein
MYTFLNLAYCKEGCRERNAIKDGLSRIMLRRFSVLKSGKTTGIVFPVASALVVPNNLSTRCSDTDGRWECEAVWFLNSKLCNVCDAHEISLVRVDIGWLDPFSMNLMSSILKESMVRELNNFSMELFAGIENGSIAGRVRCWIRVLEACTAELSNSRCAQEDLVPANCTSTVSLGLLARVVGV